jgi:endonuclease/exonuclease/phosphatase family metal-dependent hydrolase
MTPTPPSPDPSAPSSGAAPSLNPSAIPSLPGCLAPRRLSVLTFNIHGALDGRRRVRLHRIGAEIAATRADVVLLQEVDRFRARTGYRDEPALLARQLQMSPAFGANVVRPSTAPRHATSQYGTTILSRYPIVAASNTPLPDRRGLEQRGLLEATITLAGQDVHIFDTHLQNTSRSMRVAQMRAVRALIRAVPGPVLLGGDLNNRPGGRVLRIARSFLGDTWPEAGAGPGYTHGQHHPRIRIDYLLHNHWLTPVATQVVTGAVSDHRSLWAAYDLWSRPRCGLATA